MTPTQPPPVHAWVSGALMVATVVVVVALFLLTVASIVDAYS